jgi:uncharacterized protein
MTHQRMTGVLAGLAAVLLATGVQAQTLSIGSVPATSGHFPYAVAMTKEIRTALPDLTVNLIETGASVDNLKRLSRGEIEIALSTSDVAIQASTGAGQFEGKAIPGFQVLWVCDFSVLNLAVRVDSGITDLAGLQGKKFSPGIRGSGAELLTRNSLTQFGITPDYVPGTLAEAVEGIQNRSLVGYSKYGLGTGIDATLRELMVSTEMRILGMTPEQAQKVLDTTPGVTMYTLPENLIPNQTSVTAPGIAVIYGTLEGKLDDETAFRIAKAIGDGHAAISEAIPHSKSYDYKAMTEAMAAAGLTLHPGAKRYWDSKSN